MLERHDSLGASERQTTRRTFLIEMVGLLAAGCGYGTTTRRATERVLADLDQKRLDCMRAIRERKVDLPPTLKWIGEVPRINAVKVQTYPESPRTVIFARDHHSPNAMGHITQFLEVAKGRDFSRVGLEGLTGPMDAIKRQAVSAQVAACDRQKTEVNERYLDFCPGMFGFHMKFFGIGVDASHFPEYSAPGRGYLEYIRDFEFLHLYGVDDPEDYARVTLGSRYASIQALLDEIGPYQGKTLEEIMASNPLLRSYEGKAPAHVEHIVRRLDEFAAFIAYMEMLQTKIQTRLGTIPDREEMKEINRRRGAKAAHSFVSILDGENANGILIFGSGHSLEVESTLDEKKVSHVVIRSEELIGADCEPVT